MKNLVLKEISSKIHRIKRDHTSQKATPAHVGTITIGNQQSSVNCFAEMLRLFFSSLYMNMGSSTEIATIKWYALFSSTE